jgi:TolB-like protein
MATDGATSTQRPRPSVFLSYASEDRQAAQAIRDTLNAQGLEVWYDESALDGGDAWDQKIRRQIRECDLFMPLISAQTEARHEGYFRREWRLAVERTLDMADDHVFLLPIVIDDTPESGARVPDRFLTVQWMWVPGGKPTPAFEALCSRLASGQPAGLEPPKKGRDSTASIHSLAAPRYPEFPREDPGHRARFYGRVFLWTAQCAWATFMRLPKWVRILIYLWLFVALLSRGCDPEGRRPERISAADAAKLKQISESSQSGADKIDVAKLAASIAKNFPSEVGPTQAAQNPLLAIPFSAPPGDAGAQKLADSTFAQVYGRVAISHRGRVGLTNDPLPSADPSAAAERGREQHAKYVLYGVVDPQSPSQSLAVKLVKVADGSVLWSGSYPVAGADPAQIAAEVDSKVPNLRGD